MLAWLNPIALVGLAAALGPIVVHLLRRQRAGRLPFASLRFVRAASTASVHPRLPSDIWLLTIRVAIICGAAVALSQPLVVTEARRASWNGRVSRAIVVDESASMASAAARAAEAAEAEIKGAARSVRIGTDRVHEGLAMASDALVSAPPSRREIVVISDFQHGSLTAADVDLVPDGIGLRFVPIGEPRRRVEFRGDVTLGAPGVESRVQRVHVTDTGTVVRFTAGGAATGGLRLLDPSGAGDALLRAVARAGAPAPSADEPIALAFTATVTQATHSARLPVWMLRTILTMRRDPSLAEAALEHKRQGAVSESSWHVVARDAAGNPVVGGAAAGTELLLVVAGVPMDYLAAATLRSALVARRGDRGWDEHETVRIPATQLASWTRDAAPVGSTNWQTLSAPQPGDARWVWIAVLALLAIEAIVRRPRRHRESKAYADAA